MAIVYITKYALTSGILKMDCDLREGDMAVHPERFPQYFHGEGKEWHRTWESALRRAQEMRNNKLASLEKQKNKLMGLVFKDPQ